MHKKSITGNWGLILMAEHKTQSFRLDSLIIYSAFQDGESAQQSQLKVVNNPHCVSPLEVSPVGAMCKVKKGLRFILFGP